MPAPTVEPGRRPTGEIATTDSYRPTDPVWIFRGGAWRPGIIEAASSRAATVTYRPNTTRGTGVDTLTARYIARRSEFDSVLDTAAAPRRVPVGDRGPQSPPSTAPLRRAS